MRSLLYFARRSGRTFPGSYPCAWHSRRFCNRGQRKKEELLNIGDEKFHLGHRDGVCGDEQGSFSGDAEAKMFSEENKFERVGLGVDNEDMQDFVRLPEETFIDFSSGVTLKEDGDEDDGQSNQHVHSNRRKKFVEEIKHEADRVFEILQQDGPGFSVPSALDQLQLKVSNALIREVLLRILVMLNNANSSRCAKLAYKFFVWSGQQPSHKHNSNSYNLIMKVFSEAKEFKAMCRLADEMTDKGLPITARTFNILICSCGEAGMARSVVERFIKSKNFNYRPFKHSFNAILYSLLTMNQYRLVEWLHQKMLLDGYSPDVLTFNVVLRAKYMLGKLDQFHRLLDDMGKNGFAPDLHTYNLMLHVLGRSNKPLSALELLNYMNEIGCNPSVLHFTTLIDGLSRAGNIEACRYFYDEMVKKGCDPDVVCYTVMITSYVIAGEFDKGYEIFQDMLARGQLPNVYTYNAIIRGLCITGKFDEACTMVKDMNRSGCTPNFSVYSSLVGRLRNSGKVSQANDVIKYMIENGHYLHLTNRFKGYKRC